MHSNCDRWARSKSLVLLFLAAAVAGLALGPAAIAGADVIYVYDDVGRLVSAFDSTGDGVTYQYDGVGNLTGIVRGGAAGSPTISSFTPASGSSGTTVTISGTGFSAIAAQNRVTFNGAGAAISSSTATRIVTSVPVGATTGPLTVTTPGGSARSAGTFAVNAADLAPTALTGPVAAATNQTVSVSWTTTNQGTGSAKASWTDVLYFSTDALCCTGDTPIGTSTITTSVGAGKSYSRTKSVAIPRVPAGQYYLIVNADEAREVPESDETNNRRALPITIATPDLVPTGLTAAATWVIGQTLSPSWTVGNQGAGAVHGQWQDSLYLSTSSACCDGAWFLGTVSKSGSLNPGATYAPSKSIEVPAVAPGSYYLVLVVDAQSNVYEGNEANNRRLLPVTITAPDLTATALVAPASAGTEQSISLSWTVQNQGDAAATALWTDRIYLSEIPSCCSGTVMTTVNRPAGQAPGASYTRTKTLTVPSVPAGSYFLFVSVDHGQDVLESDETNNHRMVPITITTPDLVAAAIDAPAARAGQAVSVSWTVTNQGTGPAQPSWTDRLYLSADQTCCTGDSLLSSVIHSAPLAAGASYTQPKTVTVPSSRPPGNYYLILKVDTTPSVYEADESNNLLVVPFTITP